MSYLNIYHPVLSPPNDPPYCPECGSQDGEPIDTSDPDGRSFFFDCNESECEGGDL